MDKSIKQEHLNSLRDIIFWQSKRNCARYNLNKSEAELENALMTVRSAGISETIIHYITSDATGSGAREILENKGVTI